MNTLKNIQEIDCFDSGVNVLRQNNGEVVLKSPFAFGATVGATFWKTLIEELRLETGYEIPLHILDCGIDSVAVHDAVTNQIPIIVYSGVDDIYDLVTLAHRYGGKILRHKDL